MALINPYIHFNGNAEEAFTFYKSVFGGDFVKMIRYKLHTLHLLGICRLDLKHHILPGREPPTKRR